MNKSPQQLDEQLCYLKLRFMEHHYRDLAATAAKDNWSPQEYFAQLIQGETMLRWDNSIQRRISMARFPVVKTLEQFEWNWPEKINQAQVKHLFQLDFIANKANAILLAGVGLGKTHLASAIGYEACLRGHSVLFATAVDVINTLSAAQATGQLKNGLKKYLKPSMLILDELGYLPIDKRGADLLFQVISGRYENGALVITSNRAYKDWPKIFNNDATLTSAILDRLLHHADTIVIEGKSYRMKEQVEI
ncbi:ATP-binding protein [Desulfopila sp. IMCC35006]|uniref:IS21-like element helper ATPase IstB n=1 Tax=Desulfopila sp. IMCC35006 TaxID=2569542 RepID=UPI0010ABE7F6|nr:IS21-like element helper ATPase IstB [Desulfopila sp. IMCC35006]MBU1568820.1 IS21-like element helper ATPase IstB [Pseudomonadota bacterium]TKB23058.1 ATP-binding protein [Desulfopila sp. IMCC35006]